MRRERRNHSASFKAKVAVAAVRGEKTLADLGRIRATADFLIEERCADMKQPNAHDAA